MPKRVNLRPKLWLAYFLVTIAVIGAHLVFLIFLPLTLLGRFVRAVRAWPDACLSAAVRLLLRLQPWLSAQVNVQIPRDERVLLVSNHRSHLDVFFLLASIPGIRILARRSLFRIPGLGMMMRATRQIGVERGRLDAWVQSMTTVGERLRRGERVHIFPEMTRCPRAFQGVQTFTAAPFLVAIQEDATVVPVVFKNTDGVWPKGEAGLHSRQPVEVRSLEPLRAREFATAESLKAEVRRRIDRALVDA